jgi:hypothetical protein
MKVPKWVESLVLDALVYLEEQGHQVTVPTINWRHRAGYDSSGRASGKDGKESITISAGKSRLDAKLVILHEIAHTGTESKPQYWNIEKAKKHGWIFPQEPDHPIVVRNICHTDEFWDIAWKLYRWAKLPIRYCQQREYSYKAGAQAAYKRKGRK